MGESTNFFYIKKLLKKEPKLGEKLLMLIAHLEFLDPSVFNIYLYYIHISKYHSVSFMCNRYFTLDKDFVSILCVYKDL